MGVRLKTENRKIEEKKRPSAVIKAMLGTINSNCAVFSRLLLIVLYLNASNNLAELQRKQCIDRMQNQNIYGAFT